MLDYLLGLVSRLGHWGYLIIFLAAALESAAFLGLFVPGESLVLVSGFLAAQGVLDLDGLIVTVALGATLGDSLGYELGRRLGRPWVELHGDRFGLSKQRLNRADAFFARHGGKSVFLGRFVGFARAVVPFLAGSSRMPYRQFLSYNALGAMLWATSFVLLGYFLGASWNRAEKWIGRASIILGAIVFFILALTWLWRWAVRHEHGIKRRWSAFLESPRIARARRQYAPQIEFVRARLSPRGYLGLQLTLGALVLLGAAWLFGGITEDVIHGDPLTIVDQRVASWFGDHSTPPLTQVMQLVSDLHNTIPVTTVAMILALFLAWRHQWYWLTSLVIALPIGMLLNAVTKVIIERPRPYFRDLVGSLVSYSFPSGHTAAATLLYGFLAAFLIVHVQAWRWRLLIALGACFLIVLVGLSRIYLGLHYLSDVLAAIAESIAWLAFCLTAMNTLQRRAELDRVT